MIDHEKNPYLKSTPIANPESVHTDNSPNSKLPFFPAEISESWFRLLLFHSFLN